MRIELSLESTDLLIMRREHLLLLLLLSTNERQQRLAIQHVQIRQCRAFHGRSMPSNETINIWKTRINKGESASSSHRDLGRPGTLNSPPVDPFQKHRQLCAAETNCSCLHLRPDESSSLKTLGK